MSKKNTIDTDDMLSNSDEESVEEPAVSKKQSKQIEVKTKSKGKNTSIKKKVKVSNEDEKEIEDEKTVLNKKSQRKGSNDQKNKVKEVSKKEQKTAAKKVDEESEEEEIKPKKKVVKNVVKKAESDDEESEEEEIKPKKKVVKNVVKKAKSDDEESEEEEIKPKKKVVKNVVKKVELNNDIDDDDDNKEIKLVKKDKDPIDIKEDETIPTKVVEKKKYTSGTWKELFIKNLSYNTTQESLAEFFGQYGDIEETKIVYDKVTGRSKGVGFCRFFEADSANKAMEDAGNHILDDRPIAISFSNEKPPISKAQVIDFKSDSNFAGERHGIFVGNLSFKSNEKGIESFFKDCGKIIDIRIAKTVEGKMRGFAHVDFDSSESVNNAVAKSGQLLDGRDLRIDRSAQKPKPQGGSGGRSRGGRVDPMIKAKTSGTMVQTESKSKALDSDDE